MGLIHLLIKLRTSINHLLAAMEPVYKTLAVEEISDCYSVIRRLGQGTFGQVLLAQDKTTGMGTGWK